MNDVSYIMANSGSANSEEKKLNKYTASPCLAKCIVTNKMY